MPMHGQLTERGIAADCILTVDEKGSKESKAIVDCPQHERFSLWRRHPSLRSCLEEACGTPSLQHGLFPGLPV